MECLFKSAGYIAVSHVWDTAVADVQYRRAASTTSWDDAERVVLAEPVTVARSIQSRFPGSLEIWHDYLSVPQWTPERKSDIIRCIPGIFHNAKTTVVQLSDVSVASMSMMRHGDSAPDRCRAISQICNAKWFSRVWTDMEFVRSSNVTPIFQDYRLLEEQKPPSFRSFITEFTECWYKEQALAGNSHVIEKYVGMGHNLVPWHLGPLIEVRARYNLGNPTSFATAHGLLALRITTVPFDFFHAFLGILNSKLTAAGLVGDMATSMRRIAMACLRLGDFSPIFMVPASIQLDGAEANLQSFGYNDLGTFSVGREISRPLYPDVICDSKHPSVMMEHLGVVQAPRRVLFDDGIENYMVRHVEITLEITALSVEEFSITLAVRLFGRPCQEVRELLNHEFYRQHLLRLLQECHQHQEHGKHDALKHVAIYIFDLLGLRAAWPAGSGLSRLNYMHEHGGAMPLGEAGALVSLTCSRCHHSYLIRAALYKHVSTIQGANAYRIPGLQYSFSLAGGMGLFLRDGEIVGRFILGSPNL
jgi:hypothetical protein